MKEIWHTPECVRAYMELQNNIDSIKQEDLKVMTEDEHKSAFAIPQEVLDEIEQVQKNKPPNTWRDKLSDIPDPRAITKVELVNGSAVFTIHYIANKKEQ